MPKNKTGGKKFKKGKTAIGNDDERPLLEKEEGQEYAVVTKLLGNSMINCRVYFREIEKDSKGNETVSFKSEEKIGVIRNSLKKKKIFINANNVILVCIRDFEPGKVDVIYSYKDKEIKKLYRKNMIPSISTGFNDKDDGVDYQFYDENEDSDSDENDNHLNFSNKKNNRERRKENSKNQPYLVLPDNFGESSNDEGDYNNDNDNFIDNI